MAHPNAMRADFSGVEPLDGPTISDLVKDWPGPGEPPVPDRALTAFVTAVAGAVASFDDSAQASPFSARYGVRLNRSLGEILDAETVAFSDWELVRLRMYLELFYDLLDERRERNQP